MIITHSPPEPPDQHHPVIILPNPYQVRDFTKGEDPSMLEYSVGRYDEDRRFMYTFPLFSGGRTLHMGIDFSTPVGAAVYSFKEGVVFDQTYHSQDGDYGHTMIIQYIWRDAPLWALYGHLSARSIQHLKIGDHVKKGHILGWVGDIHENGGWPPHLHFQLSRREPTHCDLPGVVHPQERRAALSDYPDPQLVLGSLYPIF